jgi:hypothetical protein
MTSGGDGSNTVNAYYTGTMEGTFDEIKKLVADYKNWNGSGAGTEAQKWPTWNFTGVAASNDYFQKNSFRLYPNPTSGAVYSNKSMKFMVMDLTGQIVYQSIKYLQKQISEAANQFPRQTDTIYLGASSSSLNAEQKIKDNQKANPNYGQIAIILVKFGLATTFSVAILLFGWRLAQPQQFQQFWKKNGLPPLPKVLLQPNQTNKN